MTLKEAYKILRRFEDWRLGKDFRIMESALPTREHREAIALILASQGLDKPIADCENCRHQTSKMVGCDKLVRGECKQFEMKAD